tara:strand:+ start:169 stop:363 length:195 start_codon:yes stop_codon:yes gene_type:complete
MKLSNQAVGAIMMALQKSLMEQTDIVPTLRGMSFVMMDDGELLVENPPIVKTENNTSNNENNTN